MAAPGKTTVYVPPALMQQFEDWQALNGRANLSQLVQETIRRTIGQLEAGDREKDQARAIAALVRRHDQEIKAIKRQLRAMTASAPSDERTGR